MSTDTKNRAKSHPKVDDVDLLETIRQADSRAVNGLPDPATIAAECKLTRRTIPKRLRQLQADGKVELYESVVPGSHAGGTVATVRVVEGDER